jgi:hypothetical protein
LLWATLGPAAAIEPSLASIFDRTCAISLEQGPLASQGSANRDKAEATISSNIRVSMISLSFST